MLLALGPVFEAGLMKEEKMGTDRRHDQAIIATIRHEFSGRHSHLVAAADSPPVSANFQPEWWRSMPHASANHAGGMLAFIRKKFVGSNFDLSSRSR
jgi:hypothetical protein